MTRWTDHEVLARLRGRKMDEVDIPGQWVIESFRTGRESDLYGINPGTFGLHGTLCDFYRTGRRRVCEWRPVCYTADGAL